MLTGSTVNTEAIALIESSSEYAVQSIDRELD
jgi:hypothetical protein